MLRLRFSRALGRAGVARARASSARAKDERGAVAVMVALLLGPVMMGCLALVVDIGLQRVSRADLQALADVVALDLAREIRGSRTQADLASEGDYGNPASAVRASVARNPDVIGDELDVEVDWGSYDGGVWDTATDPPSAVRVTATALTHYAVTDGGGDVTREAIAVASNSACYRLGSFVASVKSGDSTVLAPLNHLFGVNLTLVGYQALADAQVTLGDLAAASTIGSPERLLSGTVTYSELILATIEALSNGEGSNAAAISALNTLHAGAGPATPISLGDVFHVSPTDSAALEIALDVLDIVGSAQVANGEHFIEVENLQVGVPGVGFQFTGGISLIAAAQLACGRPNSPESVARNAQLEGSLAIDFVNLPSLSIPGLATLQTGKGVGTLLVDLADGQGHLIEPPEVHCGDGTAADPHTYSVAVQTELASYALTADIEISGEVRISVLNDLGLGSLLNNLLGNLLATKVGVDLKVRFRAATTSAGTTSVANLSLPPNDEVPVTTGTSVNLDPNAVVPTVTEVKIGGKIVPLSGVVPITNLVLNELTNAGNAFSQKTLVPLIQNFNTMLLGPVARMVGLRFGGADVYAVGAVCGHPRLRG